ncbi:unnamed protein product [Durusdinium trenchii]|uniref:Uncharacterized protein n=1 Tax=Durusdinium trenchii TaxID=1381693 RepID=A0ABP0SKG9_9DINO
MPFGEQLQETSSDAIVPGPQSVSDALQPGVCYIHAVSDTKRSGLFLKTRRRNLNLLVRSGWTFCPACSLEASDVGTQLYQSRGVFVAPFLLVEQDLWSLFHFLRGERLRTDRGFTTASTFLEAVRFSKFTVGLRGCDSILQAGRILGFAAIERREKGPTKQAPILELVHLRKLHEILLIGCDPVDRLGAGAMLICIYGRARWSDLRYIHRVELEERRNGGLYAGAQNVCSWFET